jgi:hypothetical protein
MTAQPPFRKTDRLARQLSTGHGGVHPNVLLSSPICRQFLEPYAAHRLFNDHNTGAQFAASARAQSDNSPAALKSP